jgi:hypothetical protein
VRCVWVFEPAARRVHVHDAGPGSRIATTEIREGDVLDGREVVPGFRCPLAELFNAILR